MQNLINFLIELKYVAVFLGTFAEGPTVGLLAGVFAKIGYLSLIAVYFVHVLADILSDFLFYFIGYFGGKKSLPKIAKFLKFSIQETEKAEKAFRNNGGKIVVIGKITHVAGFPVILAAGITRYPFLKFVIFDSIATMIKSAILILLGYYFGAFWDKINNVFLDASLAGIIIIFAPLIYFIIKRRKNKNKEDK